ncbi:small integral membrane protein 26 [Amblyraja radiata]|uniref:small integral membrane protein 26 n=1 Tax=Amblyraja radiata TaxID=386614 RepID=UPI001403855B|nr:small integral membrane protein 26 [Amblyraja radiata]XP_032882072.1 small integral membrane protein 26 [Amblyraja radiata]XP_055494972.1 small integral membrane protein 26-like [Leucoraja erinacea]XP_055494973.1 small integral membrane protein 26-like [Leucoraja erinacea]XP_055494974.1 small integral membrane protein 26-like [Leucoraja erinacea]XP_055494975.1 small integral membrane protein 26-like [Leucoraja erinacea]XP_055494976.1 small integral membrane protein 26-like [Leucoraja erina
MKLKEVARWNLRVSLVYAVGIWTMLGAYAYLQFKKKREKAMVESSTEISTATLPQEHETSDEPQKKTKKHFMEEHVVVKEGFIPFSSRIYNYAKSFYDGSSHHSTEKSNSEK